MKTRILLIVLFAVMSFTQGYAQKKNATYYKQADIEGMWLSTGAYKENTGDLISVDADKKFGYGFTNTKSNGMPIAFYKSHSVEFTFVYTIKGKTITLYKINDRSVVFATIKIISLKPREEMTGILTQNVLGEMVPIGKYVFSYLDEED